MEILILGGSNLRQIERKRAPDKRGKAKEPCEEEKEHAFFVLPAISAS